MGNVFCSVRKYETIIVSKDVVAYEQIDCNSTQNTEDSVDVTLHSLSFEMKGRHLLAIPPPNASLSFGDCT